jgi:hypothetical protein
MAFGGGGDLKAVMVGVDPSYKYIFMLGLNLTRHSLNDVRDLSLPLHPRRFRDPHRHLADRPDLLHTPPVPSCTGKMPSDLRRRVRRNERRNQRVRRLPRRCGRVRGYARVRVREAVAVRGAKVPWGRPSFVRLALSVGCHPICMYAPTSG